MLSLCCLQHRGVCPRGQEMPHGKDGGRKTIQRDPGGRIMDYSTELLENLEPHRELEKYTLERAAPTSADPKEALESARARGCAGSTG